jgi:hypothetical protein
MCSASAEFSVKQLTPLKQRKQLAINIENAGSAGARFFSAA